MKWAEKTIQKPFQNAKIISCSMNKFDEKKRNEERREKLDE